MVSGTYVGRVQQRMHVHGCRTHRFFSRVLFLVVSLWCLASSLPHGVTPVTIVWVALACATVCTCYSISSCRLVTLTYTSTLGNFEDHFSNIDPSSLEPTSYQVGLGLFTWLRPSFYVDGDDDTVTRATVGNWREGSCTGYTTLQLEDLLEPMIEAVRIMGVLAVLISFSIFLFSLALSCLSLASWQRCVVAASCLVTAIFNGMVLMFLKSDLCHTTMDTTADSNSSNNVVANKCVMDQGGLVAIAAVILWVCAALLTYFFIESVQEPGMHHKMTQNNKNKNTRQFGNSMINGGNKSDRNKATANKTKDNRRSGTSNNKATKVSKPPKTTHSSFSIPKSKYTKADAKEISSEAAQKQTRNKASSGSIRSAPPLTSAAAPIMLPSSAAPSHQQHRARSAASNKSLEARYIPNVHREEKKEDRNTPDFDLPPLYTSHSHHATEQDLIVRGVAEKLAANNNSQKNNYNPTIGNNKESTQYFQAHEQQPPAHRGGDNPLLDPPPALNRADSRSMLSSLTSPSFVGGNYTRNEALSTSARQLALTKALEDDLEGEPKNTEPLCCGIGF
jgi:hypothetical protein